MGNLKNKSTLKAKAGQKNASKRAKRPIAKSVSTKTKSKQLATDFVPATDPSHEFGHKKVDLKNELSHSTGFKTHVKNLKTLNKIAAADIIRRKESPQRRISSGGK